MTEALRVEAGQIWRLWVFDNSMLLTVKVKWTEGDLAHCVDEDGHRCVIGISRLLSDGTLVEDYRMPFQERG